MKRFIVFGVVGGFGYLVDVGVLQAMIYGGSDPYKGRIASFIAAASFTWVCNRIWTFRDRNSSESKHRQWLRYMMLMVVGFAINYSVYAILITWGGIWMDYKFLAVAIGTLAGLCFNYPMSNYIVFKKPAEESDIA